MCFKCDVSQIKCEPRLRVEGRTLTYKMYNGFLFTHCDLDGELSRLGWRVVSLVLVPHSLITYYQFHFYINIGYRLSYLFSTLCFIIYY